MSKTNINSLEEIVIKADAWCCKFDEFISANIFEDSKIKIYSYLPDVKGKGKLGDLVIFEKRFMLFPKVVLIANKIKGKWDLEFFQNGDWFNHFNLQVG